MISRGVTYQLVAAAANELTEAGRRPTLEAVRHLLGTGSNTTLVQHLRTWRTKQEGTQEIAIQEKIPEALVVALKAVWDQVVEQSNTRINAIQTDTQKTITTIKQELLQSQQANNILQQQTHQLKQERDNLALDKSSLNHLLHDAKIELSILTEKLAGSENQLQEKKERAEELHRQNQQIQANLEHYRQASLAQRQEDQQRYEQQVNQLNYTIQSLNTENSSLTKEIYELQQKLGVISFENDKLKEQFIKIETEYQQHKNELNNTKIDLARKSQEVESTKKQLFDLQEKQNSNSTVIIDLQMKEAVSDQQVSQLQKELKDVRHQNQVLGHEKLMLVQEKAQIYGQLKQLESHR